MNEIDALFDKRSVVGARLESLLTEREYSKSGFCKACGISKSTLDKILNGMIGSEDQYEKYMRKILDCLSLTPDELIGNTALSNSRTRQLRSILHINKEEIAEAINISVDRLGEIEAGVSMTNAELRDLAWFLGTSSHCILAQNVFYPQTTELNDGIAGNIEDHVQLSGFWGHIGIMPSSSTEYIWYPITGYEAKKIYLSLNGERVVVPCMNNKLLYLNLKRIKSVVLLDDSCDAPYYYNWDHSAGEGEIPLVVYEVLEDFIFEVAEKDELDKAEYSPKLQKYLNKLIKEENWSEGDVHYMINGLRIRYADGSVAENHMEMENSTVFGLGSDLVDVVGSLYMMEDIAEVDKYISFTDWNGAVTCANTEEVSVIEMPLIAVEKSIMDRMERTMERN